jgi:hypothetical protein
VEIARRKQYAGRLAEEEIPILCLKARTTTCARQATKDYMAQLCRAGGKVRMVVLPGINHGFIGRDSASAAVGWMADRFAGAPAPSDYRTQ